MPTNLCALFIFEKICTLADFSDFESLTLGKRYIFLRYRPLFFQSATFLKALSINTVGATALARSLYTVLEMFSNI